MERALFQSFQRNIGETEEVVLKGRSPIPSKLNVVQPCTGGGSFKAWQPRGLLPLGGLGGGGRGGHAEKNLAFKMPCFYL